MLSCRFIFLDFLIAFNVHSFYPLQFSILSCFLISFSPFSFLHSFYSYLSLHDSPSSHITVLFFLLFFLHPDSLPSQSSIFHCSCTSSPFSKFPLTCLPSLFTVYAYFLISSTYPLINHLRLLYPLPNVFLLFLLPILHCSVSRLLHFQLTNLLIHSPSLFLLSTLSYHTPSFPFLQPLSLISLFLFLPSTLPLPFKILPLLSPSLFKDV